MPNLSKQPELQQNSIREEPLLMDELIIHPPGWLLRSGVSIILAAVIGVLVLSWAIKYPDKIEAKLLLTSEFPPIEMVPSTSAPIDTIMFIDQKLVKKGDLIAVLQSTANWQHVKKLSDWLQLIQPFSKASNFEKIIPLNQMRIGVLNTNYAILIQKIEELQYLLDQHLTEDKIRALESEIKQIGKLNQSLLKQEKIFNEELQLLQNDYERSKILNKDKSISDKDFELIHSKLLQQKRALEAMRSGIIQNKIRIQQLKNQKLEHFEKRKENLEIRFLAIQQSIRNLEEAIDSWQEQYLIHAPISGKLNYSEGLAKQKFVQAGLPVFTVLPQSEKGRIISRAHVTSFGLGKIEISNEIQIRLDAYPYKEHGIIKTKVAKIAPIPTKNEEGENYYLVESYLPENLITSYKKFIPFKQQLSGTATIITKEKRLIERFFENILSILNTN